MGDYDNDGWLDLVLSGDRTININGPRLLVSGLYHNNHNGTFTYVNAGLPAVSNGTVAWGDYDNDGKPDLLFAGSLNALSYVSKLYHNNGSGSFSENTASGLGSDIIAGAWGDYDSDGRLDLALTISSNTSASTNIYHNSIAKANTAPAAPSGLAVQLVSSNKATFSWSVASDAQTSASALSYNLRVGTAPGTSDVFATMAKIDASTSGGGANAYAVSPPVARSRRLATL